jgi:hypothetical protein
MKGILMVVVFLIAGAVTVNVQGATCSATPGDPNCNVSCTATGRTTSCTSTQTSVKCIGYDANGNVIDYTNCGCSGQFVWCAVPFP